METFSALLARCAGNSPVTGEFPSQRALTRNYDAFFELRLNKWLICRWLDTPSRSLWRHCNVSLCYAEMEMSFWRNFRHWLHRKLTTFGATSDEKFVKVTYPFHCSCWASSRVACNWRRHETHMTLFNEFTGKQHTIQINIQRRNMYPNCLWLIIQCL